MKRDVEIASKRDKIRILRDDTPEMIVNIATRAKLSTLAFSRIYPNSRILAVDFTSPNFLLDKNLLAYHDKVKYIFAEIDVFDLDSCLFDNIEEFEKIDYLNIDLQGKEEKIFLQGGYWPTVTKYVRTRLSPYQDYEVVKKQLQDLGFDSFALYDGEYHVVGERVDV